MNIDEARQKVLKFNPKANIDKQATYKNLHVFVLSRKNNRFATLDPVCVNADTGVISIFDPPDDETYMNVVKLLR